MMKTLKGIARNLGQILLPKYERGDRGASIGFQVLLAGVVALTSAINLITCFVLGSSLMITAGIFVLTAAIATVLELGYLRVNVGRHKSALKEKIEESKADKTDRFTYCVLYSCLQLEKPSIYPKLFKAIFCTACEVPVSEFIEIERSVQSKKSTRAKVGYTTGYAIFSVPAALTRCPFVFFKKTGRRVKEQYDDVSEKAKYRLI